MKPVPESAARQRAPQRRGPWIPMLCRLVAGPLTSTGAPLLAGRAVPIGHLTIVWQAAGRHAV